MNKLQQEIALKQLMRYMPENLYKIYKFLSVWEQDYLKKEALKNPRYAMFTFLMKWHNDVSEHYLAGMLPYELGILFPKGCKQNEIIYYDNPESPYYKHTVIWYKDHDIPLVLNDETILRIAKIHIGFLYLHSTVIKNGLADSIISNSGVNRDSSVKVTHKTHSLREKTYEQRIQSVVNLILKHNFLMFQYERYTPEIKKILRKHILNFLKKDPKGNKKFKINLEEFSTYDDVVEILLLTENYGDLSRLYNANGKSVVDVHISRRLNPKRSYPLSLLNTYSLVTQEMFDRSILETRKLMYRGYTPGVSLRHIFIQYVENDTYKIKQDKGSNSKNFRHDIDYQVNYDALKMNYDALKSILIKNHIWNVKNEAKLINLFSNIIGLDKIKLTISHDVWMELLRINPNYLFLMPQDLLFSNPQILDDVQQNQVKSKIDILRNIYARMPLNTKLEIYEEYNPKLIDLFYKNKSFIKYLIDSSAHNALFFIRYPDFKIEEYNLTNDLIDAYSGIVGFFKLKKINIDIKKINQILVDRYPNQIEYIHYNEDKTIMPDLGHSLYFLKYLSKDNELKMAKLYVNQLSSKRKQWSYDELQGMIALNSMYDLSSLKLRSPRNFTYLYKNKLFDSRRMSKNAKKENYFTLMTKEMCKYLLMIDLLSTGVETHVQKEEELAQEIIKEYILSETHEINQCLFMLGRYMWISEQNLYYFMKEIGSEGKKGMDLILKHPNFNPLDISINLLEE